MSEADAMQAKSKAYEFNPDDVASQEVQRQLLALLKWRDGVYRDILKVRFPLQGVKRRMIIHLVFVSENRNGPRIDRVD